MSNRTLLSKYYELFKRTRTELLKLIIELKFELIIFLSFDKYIEIMNILLKLCVQFNTRKNV